MPVSLSLYLLELQNCKYYVGQTDRVYVRFADHQLGTGAKWTRLHPPVKLLAAKQIEVQDLREAVLYENWMTLHYMEKYGWQQVRGGDYTILEDYKLGEQLPPIYDTAQNKIRYFINDCPYLFGATHHWLIYVLELEGGHYYIGSCKRLGKALGEHFNGDHIAFTQTHRPLKVAEWHVVKPQDSHYLTLKNKLRLQYTLKYGAEKIIGGNHQFKDDNHL